MKQRPLQNFVIAFFFTFAFFSYANQMGPNTIPNGSQTIPTDNQVAEWTSNILIATLSTDYKELEAGEKANTVRQYYSGQAWTGMDNFTGNVRPLIIKYKLKTNPTPLGPAIITEKGILNGTAYWRVTQNFNFPLVNKNAWISVIVIQNDNPPLKIQSINIKTDFKAPMYILQ